MRGDLPSSAGEARQPVSEPPLTSAPAAREPVSTPTGVSMTLTRILVTWLILAVAMFANGALRELVLKSFLGTGVAELASALIAIALILGVTFVSFRSPPDYPLASLALVSLFLVGLTVAFEFGIGLIAGHTWSEMLANYRFWEGRLWPLVLLTLAMSPFLGRGRA